MLDDPQIIRNVERYWVHRLQEGRRQAVVLELVEHFLALFEAFRQILRVPFGGYPEISPGGSPGGLPDRSVRRGSVVAR